VEEVVITILPQEEVQMEQTHIQEPDMDLKREITLTDPVPIRIPEEVAHQVIIRQEQLPDLLIIHQKVQENQDIPIGHLVNLHILK
jgi:hypothetical protein